MKTKFGYQSIAEEEKVNKVGEVFASVAHKYDLMNDLMSFFMHRLWKRKTVNEAEINANSRVLDLASGTADIALLMSKKIVEQGGESSQVTISDISPQMLEIGIKKLDNAGFTPNSMVADAQSLPFADNSFDVITIGFGIRNVTNIPMALSEMFRVLAPDGQLVILEFSQIYKPLSAFYDFYSFFCIPLLGKLVTGDRASYRYLVESIRVHPKQEEMKAIMEKTGFNQVFYINLAFGTVAIHIGKRIINLEKMIKE